MGRLMLMNRPGIQVVSGKVLKINGNEILLKNSVGQKSVELPLNISAEKIKRFKIKPGVSLTCSIKPNTFTRALAKGVLSAAIPADVYAALYSGAFNFDQCGQEKECHIFSGQVVERKPLNGGGSRVIVQWTRNGTTERKLLYSPPEVELSTSKNAVFATGPGKPCKNGEYFTVLCENSL